MKMLISNLLKFFIFAVSLGNINALEVSSVQELKSNNILSERELVKSALDHHPIIIKELSTIESQKGKIREARGSFDAHLVGKHKEYVDGYYDGKVTDLKIEKPLRYLGSEIYFGAKKSDGDLPSYYDQYFTAEEGELYAGIKLSLLQNRDIDPERAKLGQSKLEMAAKKMKFQEMQLKIQKDAIKYYWKWIASLETVRVSQNLLEIASIRDKAFEIRITKGDSPAIYRQENKQYIAKRTGQLAVADQELRESILNLSLFFRDKDGNRIDLKELIPNEDIFKLPEISDDQFQRDLAYGLENSPLIKILENQIEQLELEAKLGENKILPKLDLELKTSKDYGDGNKNLKGEEQAVLLKLDVPLEQNVGRGKAQFVKNQIAGLVAEKRWVQDQIQANSMAIKNRLDQLKKLCDAVLQEFELAKLLQQAEVKKFTNGASDLFVLNMREQNTADANLKAIKSSFDWHLTYAEYLHLLFKLKY